MTPVQRTAAVALVVLLAASFAVAATLTLVVDLSCEGKSPSSQAQTGAVAPAPPPAPARQATAPAHGYGDKIAWRGLDEGFKEAAALGRPLMLVVHAGWCPRCKELRPRFFDPAIAQASEQFVMVNVDQDETPEALRHGPDGKYIPRILFFDAQGKLDPELANPTRSKFKYFYTAHDDLAAMMQRALERHAPAAHL
ncbi:MAG TPA: thioredoxin family protein [Nannocystis sp.]